MSDQMEVPLFESGLDPRYTALQRLCRKSTSYAYWRFLNDIIMVAPRRLHVDACMSMFPALRYGTVHILEKRPFRGSYFK
jgi:hypothetical protein